jgi:hypothetical protein
MHVGVSECVCQEGFVEVEGQGCVPAAQSRGAGQAPAAAGASQGGRGGAGSFGPDPHQEAQILKSSIYSYHLLSVM